MKTKLAPDLDAIVRIERILGQLDDDSCDRVCSWLFSKYTEPDEDVGPCEESPAVSPTELDSLARLGQVLQYLQNLGTASSPLPGDKPGPIGGTVDIAKLANETD